MSYEIPLPNPEKLQEKPILNATELHKYLEENKFNPIVVVIDNTNAKVIVYFEKELDDAKKKKLFETVLDYYKKHIGIVKV
jgi:hypothetical protein